MNEEGKSFFSSAYSSFFVVLLGIYFFFYKKNLPNEGLFELFQSEFFAEELFIFLDCICFLGIIYLVSCVGALFITFVFHLVKRLWCLHKFRKPVMIYKGSDN